MVICYYVIIHLFCSVECEKLEAKVAILNEEKSKLQDKLEIATSGKTVSILIHNLYHLLF